MLDQTLDESEVRGPILSAQPREDCWSEALVVKEEVSESSEAATFPLILNGFAHVRALADFLPFTRMWFIKLCCSAADYGKAPVTQATCFLNPEDHTENSQFKKDNCLFRSCSDSLFS